MDERIGLERSIGLIPKKHWAQGVAVGVYIWQEQEAESRQQRRLSAVAAAAPETEARLGEQEETGIRVCNASGEPPRQVCASCLACMARGSLFRSYGIAGTACARHNHCAG